MSGGMGQLTAAKRMRLLAAFGQPCDDLELVDGEWMRLGLVPEVGKTTLRQAMADGLIERKNDYKPIVSDLYRLVQDVDVVGTEYDLAYGGE